MTETPKPQLCGKCGALLSGYAPDGLCAACLLESAFEAQDEATGEPSKTAPLLEAIGGMVVDGAGNVFVTGSSWLPNDRDYVTVAYSGAGAPLWTNRYNGSGNNWDRASAVAVDVSGNVFVTGDSVGSPSRDCATIKYSSAALSPIPLTYQFVGNQIVLGWTQPAFGLQSAPAVGVAYTNIPGATSPYTNAMSEAQRFFRLQAN